MKKKAYEMPTMEVVELKHQQQLLAGSAAATELQDYTVDTEENW